MKVTYEKSQNVPIVKTIEYGGNEGAGIPHPYQIEIVSDDISETDRPISREFRSGVEERIDHRVATIAVRRRASSSSATFDELIRTYGLTYEDALIGPNFYLKSVITSDLPTRTFQYSGSQSSLSHQTSQFENAPSWLRTDRNNGPDRVVQDLNGDGILDRLCARGGSDWNAAYGVAGQASFAEGVACNSNQGNWNMISIPGTPEDTITRLRPPGDGNQNIRFDDFITMDITGDGVVDLIRRDRQNDPAVRIRPGVCTSAFQCGFSEDIEYVWANPPGVAGTSAQNNPYLILTENTDDGVITERQILDMNGDGLPDLVREGFLVHFNRGQGFTGDGSGVGSSWSYSGAPSGPLETRGKRNAAAGQELIDVNADGLPDIVSVSQINPGWHDMPSQYFVIEPDGTQHGPHLISEGVYLCSVYNPGTFSSSLQYCNQQMPAGAAIVGTLSVRLNTGYGFLPPIHSPFPYSSVGGTYGNQLRSVRAVNSKERTVRDFVDVNGDGLVDLVATTREYGESQQNGDWYVLYNQGDGTFSAPLTVTAASYKPSGEPPEPGEVRSAEVISGVNWFLSELFDHNSSDRRDLWSAVIDIDGDGLVEFVSSRVEANESTWDLIRLRFETSHDVSNLPDLEELVHDHTRPGLLVRADDGMGGFTEYQYQSAASFAGAPPDLNAEVVGGGIPFPLWVVTGIRRTDGLCSVRPLPGLWFVASADASVGNPCLLNGHDVVQKFEYAKGAYDSFDREFRGFGLVTISDAPLGIAPVRKIKYHQEDYLQGKVASERLYAGGIVLVQEKDYEWRTNTDGVRTQVFLIEEKIVNKAVDYGQNGSGVATPSPADHCVLHRSSVRTGPGSNSEIDEKTRVHRSCTMACGPSVNPDDLCSGTNTWKKQTVTSYAEPIGNASIEIWDSPAEIVQTYGNGNEPPVFSHKAYVYDDLAPGQISRGRVSEELTRVSNSSSSADDWLRVAYGYDADFNNGAANGPGNITSATPVGTSNRTSSFGYDDDYHLFQVSVSLPITEVTDASGNVVQVGHTTIVFPHLSSGRTEKIIGRLGEALGDVSGATLDHLGRPTCTYEPGTSCLGTTDGTAYYVYKYGNPTAGELKDRLSSVEERHRTPGSPSGYLTKKTYLDSLGRVQFETREQLNSATNAIGLAVVKHIEYGVNGQPSREYEPYFITGESALGSAPANAAYSMIDYTWNGNAQGILDPNDRVFQILQYGGPSGGPHRFVPQMTYFGDTVESVSAEGDVSYAKLDRHGRSIYRATFQGAGGAPLSVTQRDFDGRDNVIQEWFGGDTSTLISSSYDVGGRLIEKLDPDSGTWTYRYDKFGNLVYVDDPKPNQSVHKCYDQHNREVKRYARASDAYDFQICQDQNPSYTKRYLLKYDESANIAGETNLGLGKLTTVSGPESTHRYQYDVRGRMVAQHDTVAGIIGVTSVSYRMDVDRLIGMRYPDGENLIYGYNMGGEPLSLWRVSSTEGWVNSYVTDASYDIRGRLTHRAYANNTKDSLEYHGADESFRLKRIQSEANATSVAPGIFLNVEYADYDANGRITQITDHRWTSGSLSMSGSYAYDGAGRLKRADIIGQDAATGRDYEEFSYDGKGNMTEKNGYQATFSPGKPHRLSALPLSANLVYGMAYDENGQMVAKSNQTVGYVYSFDGFGQVTGIETFNSANISLGSPVFMGYDHTGQRVYESRGSVTRRYFGQYSESKSDSDLLIKYYYFNGELVATRSDSAPQLSGIGPAPVAPLVLPPELYWGVMSISILMLLLPLSTKKAWNAGAHPSAAVGGVVILIAATLPLGMSLGCVGDVPTRFYHMGHLGGPLAVSKIGGEVDYQYRYSAYGEVRRHDKDGAAKGIDLENRREYTGYQSDEETGIQYAGLRFYDPQLSQFLSHDPAELTANPYAYVRWDPLNRIDPSGAVDFYFTSGGGSGFGKAFDGFSNWFGGIFGASGENGSNGDSEGQASGGQTGIETGDLNVPVVGRQASQSVNGSFKVPVVPGAGNARMELFIKSDTTLGGLLAGDGRDFDAGPNPSDSRAVFTLDFESGAGAFQINPTCSGGGGSCQSAQPIGAGNTVNTGIAGNTITVSGSLTNSMLRGSPSIDFAIRFAASSSGVTVSGFHNAYPSYEITSGSSFLYKFSEIAPHRLIDATGVVHFPGSR